MMSESIKSPFATYKDPGCVGYQLMVDCEGSDLSLVCKRNGPRCSLHAHVAVGFLYVAGVKGNAITKVVA